MYAKKFEFIMQYHDWHTKKTDDIQWDHFQGMFP